MRTFRYSVLILLALVTTCVHAVAGPEPIPDPATVPTPELPVTKDDSEVPPVTGTDPNFQDNNGPLNGLFTDANNANVLNLSRDYMSKLLQLAAHGENYIVELKPEFPVQQILDHIAWLEARINVDSGLGHIIHKFHLPPTEGTDTAFYGYSGTLSPALVEVLRELPIVRVIEKDHEVSISDTQSPIEPLAHAQQHPVALMQRNSPWGLSRISRPRAPNYQDPNQNTFVYNVQRGIGTDVFVLDTGVRTSHVDLQGRAFQPKLSGFAQSGGDPNGHGTHVAGIVGSRTYGVSKGARIVGLQVLGAGGTGPWSNVLKGVEYAIQSRRQSGRPTVLNISITGRYNLPLNNALISATRNNVHVVVAAGNSNENVCNTSPGSLGGTNSDVIVVGAVGQSDYMSGFSNWGNCIDVSAPGEFILSLGNWADDARREMSGTSMASPHVAGMVSVVLSQNKAFSPKDAKKFVKDRALASVKNPKGSTNKLAYLPPRF